MHLEFARQSAKVGVIVAIAEAHHAPEDIFYLRVVFDLKVDVIYFYSVRD